MDRHNCHDEGLDGSRTSFTIGNNVGKRRACLVHKVGPKMYATHSSSLINNDDMRGTILLVSSIMMIRDESLATTPLHDNFVGETRVSISCYRLHSMEPTRLPKEGGVVLKEEDLTSYH